jgi:flavin reductase (DIM6/NTAB) family NADH-FMN oxidoreductase RutF
MPLDESAKKTALRMIPYGLFVLGTCGQEQVNASTVNWVSQASFRPPLVMVGVKTDSRAYQHLKERPVFSLNFLESGQKDVAFAFFKTVEPEGETIGGYRFQRGETGAPILEVAPAWVECRVTDVIERGDHAVVVGEVVAAGLRREAQPLTMAECGVTYGG